LRSFGVLDERYSRSMLRDELASEGEVIARTVQAAVENAIRDGQMEDARRVARASAAIARSSACASSIPPAV
jgi:hypothetical protein